jgi:fructokinase
MEALWGIDLGGTKIEGVVLESDRLAKPLCRLRIDTEAHLGYEHIVQQIHRLIQQMERETEQPRPTRIGIGTPGTSDPKTGLMKNCNTTSLNSRPLPLDLARELQTDVLIANDANCFALAEATMGAAKGAEVVFGVIMGTGVGGGLVVHGRVLGGAQGIAGEWGHNELDPNGRRCYCGKIGCVETVIAGPSLARYHEERFGQKLSLKEIAMANTAQSAETLNYLCEQFGKALSVVVNIIDPDVIVLGGGVGNIESLYTYGREALERWAFNPRLDTKLVKPSLGDSAGVFGAAVLSRS